MITLNDVEVAYKRHFEKYNWYPTHIAVNKENWDYLTREEAVEKEVIFYKLKSMRASIKSDDCFFYHESELEEALQDYKARSPFIGEIEVKRYASNSGDYIKIDTHIIEAYQRKLNMTF